MKLQDAIANLLEEASQEFSNHGCNDLKLQNTLEVRQFLKDMNKEIGCPDEEVLSEDSKEYLYTYDWMVLEYLAKLIKKNGIPAAKEQ